MERQVRTLTFNGSGYTVSLPWRIARGLKPLLSKRVFVQYNAERGCVELWPTKTKRGK